VSVLSGVAVFAAVLMLLPRAARRAAVLLLVLFHFGGIFSAIFNVSPTPWVAQFLWLKVYRPYLEFAYLNNAYHFYSPEPAPGVQVWFYVQYADRSGQWFKIPTRSQHPIALEYQRRLSICESVNQVGLPGPIAQFLIDRRVNAISQLGMLAHPDMPNEWQRREPNWFSIHMLQSYARFVAGHTPHPTNPEIKVAGVKIYRVIHNILNPDLLAAGQNPNDRTLFVPYYQGDFKPDGTLKRMNDPMLYWVIPILTKEKALQSLNQSGIPTMGAKYIDLRTEIDDLAAEDPDGLVDLVEKHARIRQEDTRPVEKPIK
jgi:hypothetical protein